MNAMEEAIAQSQLKVGTAYEIIKDILKFYVDLNEDYYDIIALWIIGTYFHSSFSAFPYLFINAQKGSGKTRLEKLISWLAFKGLGQVQTGITESVLFRSEKGSTLVLDECESISGKEKSILREYLNACYKKGAIVKRNKKVKREGSETYEIETFQPYRPIVMANISGMNDVLGDRCLTLVLEKSGSPQVTKLMENFDNNPKIWEVKKLLNDTMTQNVGFMPENIYTLWNTYIKERYSVIPTPSPPVSYTDINLHNLFLKIDNSNIEGRNLELALPLFLIARMINEETLDNSIKLLIRLTEHKKEEEFADDKDISLIDFVAHQDDLRLTYTPVNELTRLFRDYIGEIDSEDRWLNPTWMGRALKRLNLVGTSKRVTKARQVILAVDRAKEKIKLFKTREEDG